MAATHKGHLVLNACMLKSPRLSVVMYGCQNKGALLLIVSVCIFMAAVKQRYYVQACIAVFFFLKSYKHCIRSFTLTLIQCALWERHMFAAELQVFRNSNWGFVKGLLSLFPLELPPAVLGQGRNGFPWERTAVPPVQESEALRSLLKEAERNKEQ